MDTLVILDLIINSICAFATVAAVIVALWQTKYPHKKKLKMNLNDEYSMILRDDGTIDNIAYRTIAISVVNIGKRMVSLTECGICLDKHFIFQFVETPGISFPISIETENALKIPVNLSRLKMIINKNRNKIKKMNKAIKVYVLDSTGKKYYVKSCYSPKKILEIKDSNITITL